MAVDVKEISNVVLELLCSGILDNFFYTEFLK